MAYATLNINLGTSQTANGDVSLKIKHTKFALGGLVKDETDYVSLSQRVIAGTLATSYFINNAVGSYTGNKVRQTNINNSIKYYTTLFGAIKNPLITGIAVAGVSLKNAIQNNIETQKSIEQSSYRRSYLGNMTTSGSRWRGGL